MQVTDFINWCLNRGFPYEVGKNWCDCVDYTTFVNFWIKDKPHTFYALDNGAFKIDNVVVNSIEDLEGVLSWELDK